MQSPGWSSAFGWRETGVDHELELGKFNHSADRRWLGGRDWTMARRVFARRTLNLNRARLHRRPAWKLGRQTVQIT